MEKKYGAAECGDCNTCGKCDAMYDEVVPELKGFDDAVAAAAAIDRNSYEKNLSRLRRATFEHDNAQGQQVETFTRNAVSRPSVPGHEGALLSPTHQGLTLYTLIIFSENYAGILNQITAVFTRRQVNIETLNVCASSTPGVHKIGRASCRERV